MKDSELYPSADFHVHFDDESIKEPEERDNLAYDLINVMGSKGIRASTLVSRVKYPNRITKYIEYGATKGIHLYAGVEFVAPQVNGDKRVDLIAMAFDPNNFEMQKLFGQDGPGAKQASAELAVWQKEFLETQKFALEPQTPEDKDLLKRLLGGEINAKAIAFCELLVKNPTNHPLIDQIREANRDEWDSIEDEFASKPWYQENPSRLTAKFLWKHFFDTDKPGYRPTRRSIPDIIHTVNTAGGVVIYSPESPDRAFNPHTWERLDELGVDGIMGWHADHLELPREVIEQIREKGKLILGGSDFDPRYGKGDSSNKQWLIGSGAGDMWISARREDDLVAYLKNSIPNKPAR